MITPGYSIDQTIWTRVRPNCWDHSWYIYSFTEVGEALLWVGSRQSRTEIPRTLTHTVFARNCALTPFREAHKCAIYSPPLRHFSSHTVKNQVLVPKGAQKGVLKCTQQLRPLPHHNRQDTMLQLYLIHLLLHQNLLCQFARPQLSLYHHRQRCSLPDPPFHSLK